jgi:hypothetical protein
VVHRLGRQELLRLPDQADRGGHPMTTKPLEATRAFMAVAERSTTLYALTEDYLHVLDLLEDPEADADALERELDSIAGQIAHKAEAIAGLIKQCEIMATMRKAEADRMRDLAATDQRNADRLRDYVLRHM